MTVSSHAPTCVDKTHRCQGRKVFRSGSWRVVKGRAPGGSYCDNGGTGRGRDAMRVTFRGDVLDLVFGRARRGGRAVLFVDGERVAVVSFAGHRTAPRLSRHTTISGLGDGRHRLRLVVKRGRAFIEGFGITG